VPARFKVAAPHTVLIRWISTLDELNLHPSRTSKFHYISGSHALYLAASLRQLCLSSRHRKPRGQQTMCAKVTVRTPNGAKTTVDEEDVIVNDSLGTVNIADSTGTDEAKETGDAKKNNLPTKED
jgi:hypothetical protein